MEGAPRMYRLILPTFYLIAALLATPQGVAAAFPPLSGLARLEGETYIAVVDAKSGSRNDTGERLYLMNRTQPDAPTASVLPCDWALLNGELPNDLESIAALPDTQDQFLAVESSYKDGKYGRIIRLRVMHEDGAWKARAVQVQHFPTEVPGTSTELDNIEGCIAFKTETGIQLLLGKRGNSEKDAYLLLGTYDPEATTFTPTKVTHFATKFRELQGVEGERRYCSDLALVGSDLYAGSCSDPGDDGPFVSQIYRIGTLSTSGAGDVTVDTSGEPLQTIPHHKVEAVYPLGQGASFLLATDDENQGGMLIDPRKN